MSTKTVSFVYSEMYDKLISQEIENGNFQSKSEFFRHVVRNWFEKHGKDTQEEAR